MARVIVSAGHTQKEPGAVVDDLREVDLTHKIAQKIAIKLRQKGIITLSVPPELELSQRIDWINKTGYKEETEDVCIEIHINDGGKSGLEGWFKGEGKNKSEDLTTKIVNEACKLTGLANQGSKSELDHSLKSLAFLHNTNPTSSLVECLYIDNPEDQKFLKDEVKLDLLADGIVKGISTFFEIDETQPLEGSTFASQPQSTLAGPSYPSPPLSSPPSPFPTTPTSQFSPPVGYGAGRFPRTSTQGTAPTPISREDKKKMIQAKYKQILGRKVGTQDLNYFLNLGLNEDQMIKRLVESQEHADLVKESQEYKKNKPKYEKLKTQNERLQVQLKDKEELLAQQNELILQKNRTIRELQPVDEQTDASSQTSQPSSVYTDQAESPQIDTQPKETLFDKLLKKLNDIFD